MSPVTLRSMALDRDTAVWRDKDRHAWRIGRDTEIAWIADNTEVGLPITSAIPPQFDAYATLEHPGTGESETRPRAFEDWDRHAASLIAVLTEHTAAQPWWLGFLECGPSANIIFHDVGKVSLYGNSECYVLVEAGPEQAATWRRNENNKDVVPDLMFPADRSWLISTLWDDDWTCLGGPRKLVDAVLNRPELQYRVREVTSLVADATPPGHTAI